VPTPEAAAAEASATIEPEPVSGPPAVPEPEAVPELAAAETPEAAVTEPEPEPAPAEAPEAESAEPEAALAQTPEAESAEPEPAPAETPEAESAEPEAAPAETPEAESAEPEAAPVHPEQEHLARENAQRIESEIDALRSGHMDGAHREFRAFFEHERRLHELFKELHPLHPHDHHRLWKTLKQVGADTRRAQQEEWESRRYQSIEARETVDEMLRAAEALTQSAESGADCRRAESTLNEIRNLLGSAAPGTPGQLLIGPDRRACWDRWRGARDALRKKHGGRQEQAHQELAARVTEVAGRATEGDPFQATQRIKELQAQLGKADLRRGQFEELRKRLSAAWQQAQARMAEQRHERTEQQAEWRGRLEQHLARWRQTLQQKQGQLEHLVGQAARLIEMERNARSEDFAEQVRQWQAATAEKRHRTEESVAELEERIRSTERRLGGRRAPAEGGPAKRKPRRARKARATATAPPAPAVPAEAPGQPPAPPEETPPVEP
jgi:hypothetical protein